MTAAAAVDRSCVILVTSDSSNDTYTLHHIDVAPFFSHPDPNDDEAMDDIPLPPVSARFDRPPFGGNCVVNCHLLRGGAVVGCDDVRVVSTDVEGRTVIYDVFRRAVRGGPVMRARKGSPISDSIGDGLFVLERIPDGGNRCFEALRYDKLREDWFWHGLPQPPYVRGPGYTRSPITAHTAAAGGRIWTCTENGGTYSFDTRRRSWRKEGDWALPFVGKAEHVPVCGGADGLSFGFASISGPLCTVDLATATAESPPEVRGVWEEFGLPGGGLGGISALVHLGSGKMCIFRIFHTGFSPPIDRSRKQDRFVVITPVEVGPSDDGGREIKMVKHRSKRIKFDKLNGRDRNWVL